MNILILAHSWLTGESPNAESPNLEIAQGNSSSSQKPCVAAVPAASLCSLPAHDYTTTLQAHATTQYHHTLRNTARS